ncbi:nuclear transport factor 2 family protein [Porticoccus sp. W117]|uniref:nuclear transport factor 2 family protein n=1 Tax=Porticoccus sp. W117 TaxID=3054777 RepID=UPI002592B12E|nr:nuclear transport factor 2 family protein [Porticoccus sp. W117]
MMITPDQAAVAGIVESVGLLADRSEYDALARLYADEFTLDYSSLNGQAPATKTPEQLMSEWASVLPGFDRTRHGLSNVQVSVNGNNATATADVMAYHWVDDLFWQVDGSYDYKLARQNGQWKITSMTFNLEGEQGTREVFGPAMAAAGSKLLPGNSGGIGERNKATVRIFFKYLEQEDIPALVNLFAEDGVQINPYTGGVFPSGAVGREELLKYWAPVPGYFDGMIFPVEEILATEDPNIVFVRYQGKMKLKNGAGIYENKYYSTFRFNDEGKITEYVEIFDPVVAARGFGLLDQLK